MTLPDLILQHLSGAGDYLSGEVLARDLGVSRAAISQNVAELRKLGWSIEAQTKRGYWLQGKQDILSGGLISSGLAARGIPCGVHQFAELGSTNDWALEHMDELGTLSLVLANKQTAGRGRFNRRFESPADLGLYMSLVIKDRIDAANAAVLTCAVAVAVRRAVLRCHGVELGIKWVNDLYLGDKKVAGILTEASMDMESGSLFNVVIGVGINIHQRDFPQELARKAGAILAGPTGNKEGMTRNTLAEEIVYQCLGLLRTFPASEFMTEYRAASTVLGTALELHRWNETFCGRVLDIDDRGQLILEFSDGSTKAFNSGEVSTQAENHGDR